MEGRDNIEALLLGNNTDNISQLRGEYLSKKKVIIDNSNNKTKIIC